MKRGRAQVVAQMGLLFALAVCLSFLESLLPPLLPVPGVKPGLANVVTMYCVCLLGTRKAFVIAVLKSLFVLLTRGVVAGILSLCGGVASIAAMLLLLWVTGRRCTYAALGMLGAVVHNLAQLAAASVILGVGQVLWYYLPLLVASGICMGILTSILLRAVLPALKRGAEPPR